MENRIKLENIYKVYGNLILNKEIKYMEEAIKNLIDSRNLKIKDFDSLFIDCKLIFKNLKQETLIDKYIWDKMLAKNTTLSTLSIEGLKLSHQDIDLIDQNIKDKKLLEKHTKNVIKSTINMVGLYENFTLKNNLTIEYLKDIHKKIFTSKSYNPGNFKASDNWYINDKKERIYYLSSSEVIGSLNQLIDFINDKDTNKFPITKASLIHVYLLSIHPFVDGNGRFTRFIVNKYISKIYDTTIFIDGAIDKDKDYYIDSLTKFRNGEYRSIFDFHVGIIFKQNQIDYEYLEKIKKKYNELKNKIENTSIKKNQIPRISLFLVKNGVFASKTIELDLNISIVTANKYINELLKEGILKKVKSNNKQSIYLVNNSK